jgi:glycosyltransferase involved in cell wall biosynthesis
MIFVSEDLESDWKRELLWRRKSKIIPNIPPFEINADPKVFRSDGVFRILTVGDTSARKNVVSSIEAVKSLILDYPRIELHIVGIGLGNNECFALSHADSQYYSNIHWHGYLERPQLKDLMLTCDVLLQPSLLESFGLTLLEGMALGLPVIAGISTGGTQEVIGDAGILVDIRNNVETALSIKNLIENPEVGVTLSEKGKIRIASKFSTTDIVSDTVRYYLQALNTRNRARTNN